MVPPSSVRISRARTYSGSRSPFLDFTYRAITVSGRASHPVQLSSRVLLPILTPIALLLSVWPLSLSLAATHKISFDFSSYGYLDVSLPHVPFIHLFIQCMITTSSVAWFPNSEICGLSLIYSYPQLIAVSHVLHRLLMPRHSPYALFCLNFCLFNCFEIRK